MVQKKSVSKKNKGGAFELGPLAATGLLLAAQGMYHNMLEKEKGNVSRPRGRVPRKRRVFGGNDGVEDLSASPETYTDAAQISSVSSEAKFEGVPAEAKPETPNVPEVSPDVQDDAKAQTGGKKRRNVVRKRRGGADDVVVMDEGDVAAETGSTEDVMMGGKKRRATKKKGGNVNSLQQVLEKSFLQSGTEQSGGKKRRQTKKGGAADLAEAFKDSQKGGRRKVKKGGNAELSENKEVKEGGQGSCGAQLGGRRQNKEKRGGEMLQLYRQQLEQLAGKLGGMKL